MFSHSESCLLILFTVSFAVQKLLSLIRPHLFIFVFISITLVKSKRKKQKQKILSLKAIFSQQRVKMMLDSILYHGCLEDLKTSITYNCISFPYF